MKSAEYEAWKGIRKRCNNSRCKGYKNYGGRGIVVCNRWNSFSDFLSDMGRKPTPLHTIERVDNNGNYEPSNCRWATRSEQNTNKRNLVTVKFQGKSVAAIVLEKRLGLPRRRIYDRLRKGWSDEDAIATPSTNSRSTYFAEFNGEKLSMAEWDRKLGFSSGRMFDRIISKGWDISRAVTTPQRKSPSPKT